jgi:hypothetical protein
MDRRDLHEHLAGVCCTVCGERVPTDRIRILAERETLTFIELCCSACGTDTLGMLLASDDPAARPILDVERYGEFGPRDEARLTAGPVRDEDVTAMRAFLAGYRGDLRSLLGETGPGDEAGRPA